MIKRNTLLILVIFFSLISTAQKKILFDNTKSETASNADWIVDISEPTPYPAQSGITSSTSETYWDGAISAWGVEMAKRGFIIEILPSYSSITYGTSNAQDLLNYDVFVVCEPNNPFSESEKTAIMNFVKNGGGLFMVADHENADRDGDGWDAYYAWRDLITDNSVQNYAFGMLFDNPDYINDYPCYNTADRSGDPLLYGPAGTVNAMEFHGSAAMSISTSDNPTVKAAVYRTGASNTGTTDVMVAYAEYGQGRVVGLVDSSPADDGTGDPDDNLYYGWDEQDNGILITNATLWLAEDNSYVNNINNSNEVLDLFPTICFEEEISLIIDKGLLPLNVSIVDVYGRTIKIIDVRHENSKITLNNFSEGIYFLNVNTSKLKITKKFIIN